MGNARLPGASADPPCRCHRTRRVRCPEAGFIVESALISTGVGARTRKRLLAEPRPASVSDLGACPLPEPLLSAVAVIAFAAMAEATSPQDAVRQMPALLRRMGLARLAADMKAGELLEEYTGTYLVLSDLSAQLRTEAPQRPFRGRLPVATMMAVGEGINAHNTNELHRQVTRQAMATLLRHGIRATVSSGVPLHPAASTVIRAVGHLLPTRKYPALQAQRNHNRWPLLVAARPVDHVEEGLAV